MIKFAANLTMMFNEWSFIDRFEVARDAGFEAVEFSFPANITTDKIAEQLTRTGLRQVLATVPVPSGTKGLAAISGAQGKFREDFLVGLDFAVAGKSPLLHVLSGVVERTEVAVAHGRFLNNMEWAIEQAALVNVRLVVEAINQVTVPNYFIASLGQAMRWSTRLPGLGVILDIYHACMEGLDPVECVASYARCCDHLQIAGYPDRHEPNCGSLDLEHLWEVIDCSGYTGWMGCEYLPEHSTLEGLHWLRESTESLACRANGWGG